MILPYWQTDLDPSGPGHKGFRRSDPKKASRRPGPGGSAEPLALTESVAGAERLAAISAEAAALGLAPGMTLADARALVPHLAIRPAEPEQAAAALGRLADWALRFTPWVSISGVATSGSDGLWLDITGCAHLFGGEAGLLARLHGGLARRGFAAQSAIADTPGAAWAVARFGGAGGTGGTGGTGGIVAPGEVRAAIAPLPVAALRLDANAVAGLERVGLRRIDDLLRQPRAPLATRYGRTVLRRLDQALGRAPEPITPRCAPLAHHARRAFAEPIADTASITGALDGLLETLCGGLAHAGLGARRLALTLFRLDGDVRAIEIGTSRPAREARALARLFADRFDGLDVGEGIEVMLLAAAATDSLPAHQTGFTVADGAIYDGGAGLADLVDRLANRIGEGRVARLGPRASHQPDRAVTRLAATAAGDEKPHPWPKTPP
ncbi:MAG: DNA polymerase Y family protein, partial [Alphaproteobacteria bacterium]